MVTRAWFLPLVLVLAACGGGSVAPGGDNADGGNGGNGGDGGGVAPAAVEAECEDQLGGLLAALEELDGRLNVGLVFNDYTERVGDVSVAYGRVEPDELGANCRERVGVPLEDAMNAYIRAQNEWSDCIEDTDCSTDSIESSLQAEWAEATGLIEEAREALDE